MSEDRREQRSVLTCKHCGTVIGSQSDIIRRALKRLGMYPKERNGKNSKIK